MKAIKRLLWLIVLMLLPMLMQAGNILDTSKSFGGRTRSVLPVVEADFNNDYIVVRLNRYEGDVCVKIYDASGNVVLSDILQTDGKTEKTLDLSGYENGQYVIEVELSDITYSGSFDLH